MAYVDTRAVARRERLIYAHIERTLSHKHIQFALERDCMVDIGHLPRKCEVVGSEYIAMRFDGWENALNTIYSGNKNDAFTPLKVSKRKIVQDLYKEQARIVDAELAAQTRPRTMVWRAGE